MVQEILLGTYLLCLGMSCVMLYSSGRWQKGILIGVTVPETALALAEVQTIQKRYRQGLIAVALGCAAAYLPLLRVRSTWLLVSLWMLLLYAAMLLPYLPFVRAHRALKMLKKERGWAGTPPLRVVDTRASAQSLPKPIGLWTLVLPLAVSIVPALLPGQPAALRLVWLSDAALRLVWLSDAALLVVLWACGRWTFRRREDMVTSDSTRNQTLLRVRRCYWDRFWRLNLWGCAGLNLCIGLFQSGAAATAGGLLFTVILVGGTVWMELRVRAVQETLTRGADIIADEDDAWLLGSFYYNPADTRVMVSKRLGLGSTMNLATRAGKWVTAVTLVVMIGGLLLGPAMGIVDELPTRLEIRGQTLVALHGRAEKYTLTLDSVTGAVLRERLPECSRLVGTGLDHYLQGDFSVQGEGAARFCLDPTAPPFLRVEAGGSVYWLSAETPEQTRKMAQWLQEQHTAD